MEQINADPYCKEFNKLVAGGATASELRTMFAGAEQLLNTKPVLQKGNDPVLKEVAEVPGPARGKPEGATSGAGESDSTVGKTTGLLNIVGLLQDFATMLYDASPEGQRAMDADQMAQKDVPPDRSPGFFGRLHNRITGDPSPYYSPERLKDLNRVRQQYLDEMNSAYHPRPDQT